jgi:DNA-binding transcriptional MocR family regulator
MPLDGDSLPITLDAASREPLTDQLVNGVRQLIEGRQLVPGARLPSIRQMAAQRGISRFTVMEAYDRLVANGLIESRRGSGFFVARKRGCETATDRTGALARAVNVANLLSELCAEDGLVKHASGCLPDAWYEESDLRRCVRHAAAAEGSHLSTFGHRLGFAPLRDFVARRMMDRGVPTRSDQVLLTFGATQALDLVIRYLLSPGDAVLVDDPGYYNLFGHLKLSGVTLLAVPRGKDGPDLNVLESLVLAHRPKAYFTQSVLSNPSSSHISPTIAHRLLRLAESEQFQIIEDDVFGDIAPARTRLATLDGLQRVIYIGSFAKTISPSVRVGFVVSHPEAIERLTQIKLLTSMTSSQLHEKIVYEMLVTGHYRRHVAKIIDRLEGCRERMLRDMERVGFTPEFVPDAGAYLWLRHREISDSLPLAEAAVGSGMRFGPGAAFRPHNGTSPWLRFNAAIGGNHALYEFLQTAGSKLTASVGVGARMDY